VSWVTLLEVPETDSAIIGFDSGNVAMVSHETMALMCDPDLKLSYVSMPADPFQVPVLSPVHFVPTIQDVVDHWAGPSFEQVVIQPRRYAWPVGDDGDIRTLICAYNPYNRQWFVWKEDWG